MTVNETVFSFTSQRRRRAGARDEGDSGWFWRVAVHKHRSLVGGGDFGNLYIAETCYSSRKPIAACAANLDWRSRRGLDKSLLVTLAFCEWVGSRLNLILTGPTGVGRTYLACALGQKACREGYSVEYHRVPRLFPELGLAKGDGRYGTLLRRFARTDLLILDDWGLYPFTDESRRDLLEILEDRCGKRSTLVTGQLPIDQWHQAIGDPTLADAILDRIVHDAYKINLQGESMRKRKAKIQHDTEKKNPPEKDPSGKTRR